MALLIFGTGTGSHPAFLSSLSSPSSSLCLSSTLAMISTNPLFKRLHKEFSSVHGPISLDLLQPRHKSIFFKERSPVMVKASSSLGVDGAADPPSEDEDNAVSVENLPLESKLQLKLEQKMRMKLAKKIRHRRKKLVRKRRMRKKGRWPPSKMSKNKNV
ncbi:50S ribosomal protein 5 alpha, chloroplastic [Diospyros lotus]|uniref:50S ribosomal protein 5 alpha, chloroplastic n=1 Tax=Diospyros lotus TaxID=55363 RepID=UPI00224E6176|nr:50S ribosomal protein 5 alpha, chloroplastic [Diospyros lotus]